MNKSPLKLDSEILLTLLLKQCKMSRTQYEAFVTKRFNLSNPQLITTNEVTFSKINPKTDQPYFGTEHIYDTGEYLVKATQYGKIKDIQSKPRSVVNPKIVVKKKRKF